MVQYNILHKGNEDKLLFSIYYIWNEVRVKKNFSIFFKFYQEEKKKQRKHG